MNNEKQMLIKVLVGFQCLRVLLAMSTSVFEAWLLVTPNPFSRQGFFHIFIFMVGHERILQ